jgi:hypothetical protein
MIHRIKWKNGSKWEKNLPVKTFLQDDVSKYMYKSGFIPNCHIFTTLIEQNEGVAIISVDRTLSIAQMVVI